MQASAILESALYVRDLDEAEAFYESILGLERIARSEGRHVFFRCGSGVLLLFNSDQTRIPAAHGTLPVPPHGTSGNGHLCFRAGKQEINRWREHLVGKGIEIEADFEWPSGGRSIYFRDPSGNSLEFAEPRLWALE